MKVLLASPIFSQHYDSGLFWLAALSRQGHLVSVWDYRMESGPPLVEADVALIMKGENIRPKIIRGLPGKRICYWPDMLERTPGVEKYLALFDEVYTPVRPTPTGMIWLPTGWEPRIHGRIHSQYQLPDRVSSVFIGTATERKKEFLVKIRPDLIFGNGWGDDWDNRRGPVYLHDYVSALTVSDIAINIHRDLVGVGRRFFEFIACTFTLTDIVPGVKEILGHELTAKVGFYTPEEGLAKKNYYSSHPEEREQLWQREREAITPYTYDAAVQMVLQEVVAHA